MQYAFTIGTLQGTSYELTIPSYGGGFYWFSSFIARIIASVEKLAEFPDVGWKVPEAEERKDVRELIFQGYRIIYLHQADHVYIVTVIHGSRDLSGMENKPWDGGMP